MFTESSPEFDNTNDPLGTTEVLTQELFKDPITQEFLTIWTVANDGIIPTYMERQEWEERGGFGNVLSEENESTEKRNLFIPKDLKLWELIPIVEQVERNTYQDSPEEAAEHIAKLSQFGQNIRDAGIYIAQRIDAVQEGREIAQVLAKDFYDYGTAITTRKGLPDTVFEEIEQQQTTAKTTEIDEWIAGKEYYSQLQQKITTEAAVTTSVEVEDSSEVFRCRKLGQYFKIAQRTFEREQSEVVEDTTLPPTVAMEFLRHARQYVARTMETPIQGSVKAVFRRGLRELASEINENSTSKGGEKMKLYDKLKIDEMRESLDKARTSGKPREIARLEKAFARRIQKEVSKFPYVNDFESYRPRGIRSNGQMNCVGYSMLGSSLLSAVGIEHYAAGTRQHSTLFVRTSEGHLINTDMQDREGLLNIRIHPWHLSGKPQIADILGQLDSGEEVLIEFRGGFIGKRIYARISLGPTHKTERSIIILQKPEEGLRDSLLNTMALPEGVSNELPPYPVNLRDEVPLKRNASTLSSSQFLNPDNKTPIQRFVIGENYFLLGKYRESLEHLEFAAKEDPGVFTYGMQYARALCMNGLYDKALIEYQRLRSLPQKTQVDSYPDKHSRRAVIEREIGVTLFHAERYSEVIQHFQKAFDKGELDKDTRAYEVMSESYSQLGDDENALGALLQMAKYNTDYDPEKVLQLSKEKGREKELVDAALHAIEYREQEEDKTDSKRTSIASTQDSYELLFRILQETDQLQKLPIILSNMTRRPNILKGILHHVETLAKNNGEDEVAIEVLKIDLSQHYEGFEHTAIDLGHLYLKAGDKENAREAYKQGLPQKGKPSPLLDAATIGFARASGIEEVWVLAEQLLEESLVEFHRFPTTRGFLAETKVALGKWQEAIEIYETAKTEVYDGGYGELDLSHLGIAHQNLGHYQEAEAAFQRQLVKNPDNPENIYRLGFCQSMTGKLEESINTFARGSRSYGPQHPIFYYSLGYSLEQDGQSDLSQQAYQEYLERGHNPKLIEETKKRIESYQVR